MTQEEKELLLKDLCARLPYEVKVQYEDGIFTIDYISGMYEEIKLNTPDRYTINISKVKPYLLPLSSMTEEQYDEFTDMAYSVTERGRSMANYYQIDWYYKNHFDYRGLIEKGLAIDATGLNIY